MVAIAGGQIVFRSRIMVISDSGAGSNTNDLDPFIRPEAARHP